MRSKSKLLRGMLHLALLTRVSLLVGAQQLDDEPLLLLAEDWVDGSDDPDLAADFDPVADDERLRLREAAGRHDRVAAAEFVAVEVHRPA
jgi:hypothetical protein